MSNGRIDEMIGPQQQLSSFIIIIQFTKFYSFLLSKFVHFHRGALKESYTWYSGNSSDCQIALRTDHFVDQTFRGPTEVQLNR